MQFIIAIPSNANILYFTQNIPSVREKIQKSMKEILYEFVLLSRNMHIIQK